MSHTTASSRRTRPRAAAALACLALALTGCGRLVDITPVGRVELPPVAETSVLVAANGSVLTELHSEQDRDVVPLARIPEVLREAVVAVEDRRFYGHAGVDARAVARAVKENAAQGRITQGGSTITQQLAKNALTGSEQTLERKLNEASLALQLEAQFTKDQILEQYLNTVYFGNGGYGVQTAAQRYFGVDVDSLGLPQAALLAGMLRAPTHYDPYTEPDAARQRRDLVITLMENQGRIDTPYAEAARRAPLGVMPPPEPRRHRAPYFVAHVLEELQRSAEFHVLGDDPSERAERLFRGGLRIETTLDTAWQAAAEQSLNATVGEPDDPAAALVAIDPATGGVRALVGGRDFYDPDDETARFNLATDALRQPGSTFKSIVLAAALSQGRSLDEVYPAGPMIEIPAAPPEEPESWVVRNYGDSDFGELTLRQATASSVNVVYAQVIEQVGPAAVGDLARRMGIDRELPALRSLALGAVEVSPLELASVQATFAAGGVYRRPTVVTRILDGEGRLLWERPPPIGERVLDEGVAWLVTGALKGVVTDGTGRAADLRRPTAGKTGTTQDGADAWFAGYTPDLAAAIWVGFPEGRVPMQPPRTRITVEGGDWPAEAFARFGVQALADVPADDFEIPEAALTTVRVDTTRGCVPNAFTPPEFILEQGYLSGTEPTEVCTEPAAPPTADVPDVAGLPADEAVRLLEEAGFIVDRREEFNVVLPPGFAVRQVPAAGAAQTLLAGYVASVFVSVADRSPVPVPDVLDLPLVEARAALEAAGFVVEVTLACPDGTDACAGARSRPGQVWEQSPAGAEAPRASIIRVAAYPSA